MLMQQLLLVVFYHKLIIGLERIIRYTCIDMMAVHFGRNGENLMGAPSKVVFALPLYACGAA
jgi:hypothetical protein